MNISIHLFAVTLILFLIVVAILSYYLGRRKTQTPFIATLLGIMLALIPPFALIYLVALMFRKDVR